MNYTKHTINELLVGLFNYITYIEERNLKDKNVSLKLSEVHLLENIEKASDNTMSYIAKRCMVTQGTLTTNVKRLVAKGYVERYKDEKDGRIVRLRITDQAKDVLKIHDEFHETLIDKTVADLKLDQDKVLIDSLANLMEYFSEEYAIEKNI
jgi:DNA-binding MarR family transcriptional regulator